jgi:S-methylmethionine-dependent homocysteine/selenocysteine methylase
MSVERLREDLQRPGFVVIADGATGTELPRFGGELGSNSGSWSGHTLEHRKGRRATRRVHQANARAGARLITLNTFRTNKLEDIESATLAACKIGARVKRRARVDNLLSGRARAPGVLIGGSIGTDGDCYEPDNVRPRQVLQMVHGRFAEILAEGGVDYAHAETQNNIEEIEEILKATKKVKLPVALSVWCPPDATRSARQEFIRATVNMAGEYKAVSVGPNCLDAKAAEEDVDFIDSLDAGIPISVHAQGWDPTSPDQVPGLSKEEYRTRFLHHAERSMGLGAQVVGGCCGVPWEWIADLADIASARNQSLISPTQRVDW